VSSSATQFQSDVVIIGGGVMGLFTAFRLASRGKSVTVLEAGRVGDPSTASYGQTRSWRNDYLDPLYTKLATEAIRQWDDLAPLSPEPLLVNCGMLNLVKTAATPDPATSYAEMSAEVLEKLDLPAEKIDSTALKQRFPQFVADSARLVTGGFAYLPAVTAMLQEQLAKHAVRLIEGVQVQSLRSAATGVEVESSAGSWIASAVVVSAGHGSNEVLRRIEGCELQLPTSKDRPSENKYYVPSADKIDQFTPDKFPVFALLDVGIYGHPFYPGRTPGVKVGYYNPPDLEQTHRAYPNVASFVEACIPALADAEVRDVTETDLCHYDLVDDDDFIMGPVPGNEQIFIATGWRGTGYKFAPWVGSIMSDFVINGSVDAELARFRPSRFMPATNSSESSEGLGK
jgi:glycine/D-amino acid oxidase-like deaminating enzyme